MQSPTRLLSKKRRVYAWPSLLLTPFRRVVFMPNACEVFSLAIVMSSRG
jgi:hypothetical protein